MKQNLIVIAGPTASGKTDLSIRLAKHFSTEVISADSRQFYKEMNIGTAKPLPHQLKEVKHHFINSLSVTQSYNAGLFETDTIELLEKLFRNQENVIMTGGSGLYIHAVLNGVDALPKADEEIRGSLKEKLEQNGIEALQQQLKILDPEYFEKADKKNPQRLMRAIEVCLISGKKYSSLIGKKTVKRNFNSVLIGLQIDRKILYERIRGRVNKMVEDGLAEEVKKLLPYKDCNALETVGYKELVRHFEGTSSFSEAIELIKKNTCNYAKRQMTWFRKMDGITWLDTSDKLLFDKCISILS